MVKPVTVLVKLSTSLPVIRVIIVPSASVVTSWNSLFATTSTSIGNPHPVSVIGSNVTPYDAASQTIFAQMRAAFGAELFADTAQAFAAATMALEVFQQSPSEFYPYSSRYDAVLRGQATLTPREARGLALFNNPAKGNCASCHLSTPTPDGAFPLFTDFGHIAIGVPRNEGLRANDDPRFFDLGLCGPLRPDFVVKPGASDPNGYCGRFRAPSLRNVALRKVFFHNGVIRSLDEAVRFYATRDTDPRRWYGRDAHGNAKRYDDLPRRYHANVNTEPPFGGRRGSTPALNEAEIGDIVAFLKTLTDADLDADLDAGQLPPR